MWGEETLDQAVSPDGRYIAGVFRRDGGVMTSGRTRHVNLRRGSEPFPRSSRGILDDGQVYVTDKETWDEPITLHWKDASTLSFGAHLAPARLIGRMSPSATSSCTGTTTANRYA